MQASIEERIWRPPRWAATLVVCGPATGILGKAHGRRQPALRTRSIVPAYWTVGVENAAVAGRLWLGTWLWTWLLWGAAE